MGSSNESYYWDLCRVRFLRRETAQESGRLSQLVERLDADHRDLQVRRPLPWTIPQP